MALRVYTAKIVIWIVLCFICLSGFSQDIQFSQFYNAQLYQNPAFAGAAHHNRFSLHQRLQWPKLDAKYTTSMFSYDTYFNKYNSGFGFVAFKDYQGASNISSTDIGLQYSYELHLTRDLTFRSGLQLSYVNRSLDYGLTLPEDFTNNGQIAPASSVGGVKNYIDVSSGGILYSNNIWIGFSAHHMNTPNTSFAGNVTSLPAKFELTGGYKINLNKDPYHHVDYLQHDKEISLTPTFHYKSQGKSDQLDLGLYGTYDFIIAGIWYRGIPLKNYNKDFVNNESMVLLAGYKFKQISITYSYDFTISHLVRAGTGGAHELNVTYIYKKRKRHKPMKRLPCPNFNHR